MQKNELFNWSDIQLAAFEKVKKVISNTVTNCHFDSNFRTRVKCDAYPVSLPSSNNTMGAFEKR